MAKPKFEDVAISLIRLGSPKVSVQGGLAFIEVSFGDFTNDARL